MDGAVSQSTEIIFAAIFFVCIVFVTAFKEETTAAIAIIWTVFTAACMSPVEYAATTRIAVGVLLNAADICLFASF